ncbi:MAG: methyltransferase [Defluviitaleaceae bacterium]|nr:methyltransferase [Defluviitaleaceae bacterium]
MRHYFTNDNQKTGRTYSISFEYGRRGFVFQSADGVFSKDEVDFGTSLLINTALPCMVAGIAPKTAVDLGCGYGIIGIVMAACIPDLRVVMVDVNERALELARLNARNSGVAERVALAAPGAPIKPADTIITNPPFRAGKSVVIGMFEASYAALNKSGRFYAVFRKQQGAESYIKDLMRVFGNVGILAKKKGYVVVECVKEDKE